MRSTRLFFSTASKSTVPAFKFKFDRTTANRKMAQHSSIFESGSRDKHQTLPEASAGDPVTECFVPCYSADISAIESEYVAEFGINRTETHFVWQTVNNKMQMVPQTYVVTDWFACQGKLSVIDYPFGTLQTQFYAGYDYPRQLIEPVIRTSFVDGLKPLTEKMINAYGSRKIVQPHEMTRAKAIEKVIAGVNDLERERAKAAVISRVVAGRGVYPDGGVRINSINVMFKKANYKMFSYYVGVYVYQYPYGDFSRYKFLNAHNSTINGNKVLSTAKFTTAGAVFGGVVSVLSALANPYLIPVRLSIQIVVGATLAGAASAAFARLFNQYDRYHFVNDTQREKEQNEGYPKSFEDRETKRFADSMNKNGGYSSTSTHPDKLRLPREKLSLLGLDPDRSVTLKILHKAYITKLKQCHPDMNNMNEEDANAMTSAVNNAYHTLKHILEINDAQQEAKHGYTKYRP